MMRWIVACGFAGLLAGCVSYPEYRSYDDSYYASDSYGEPVYAGGSSYYSPGDSGGGDYYYQDSGYSSAYLDYPYYYSLFYPLNRWSVDPYWYPRFYYGVTYYPRSYFSAGYGGDYRSGYGYGGRYGGYLSYSYSPYRNAWVDSYYDWHSYYDRSASRSYRHYAPRYGSARNEAAWLSDRSRYSARNSRYRNDGGSYNDRGLPRTQVNRQQDGGRNAVLDRRASARGADYGSSGNRRADPGVSGFGYDGGNRSERTRPSRYIGDSGDTRTQSPRSTSNRTYAPTERSRQADTEGYRIQPSRATTYRQPVERQTQTRETPVDRERSARPDVQTQYRQPAPVRDSTRYESSPRREQSAAPREAYTPRAQSYREPAQQRGSEAPQRNYQPAAPQQQRSYEAPQRAERSEARSEARVERSVRSSEGRSTRETEDE